MTDAIAMRDATATISRLVERSELTPHEISHMHGLLNSHFDGVTSEHFTHDLDQKNWVILIERAGRLVGFSTILAYELSVVGQTFSVIYSGDTIVSPEAWNTPSLPRTWIESVVMLRRHYPRGRYVWLLITSGFRTYRFLPVFWREFYPRYDAPTPPEASRLMNDLARERFGSAYKSSAGIVRFEHPQRLRDNLAVIPAGRSTDPHVAFYASQNPGHASGDELVCLTELTPVNLTPAGRRMAAAAGPW